jgi:hypothetical protein
MLAIRSALAMAASDGLTAPLLWKKLLSLTYELLGHGLYTVDQAHSTPDQRQSARVLPELSKPCSGTVELRGLEPLTFSLRTRRATNCAIAPQTAWGRSARRLYHRQAEADFCDSSPFTACDESDGESGASAVTGPSWGADDVAPGPERSMVRTVRGASGFET